MYENILLKTASFFIEHPYKEIYLREFGKKLKISVFAAKKYLDMLLKEQFIKEERKANLRYFKANVGSLFYKYEKIAFAMRKLQKAELVEYIISKANASSIVLFGSVAKGENEEKSDIDIVIIGNNKLINFEEVEKKIGAKINEHRFKWNEWKQTSEKNKAFYYDVISYGIPIYGELPIVK